MNVETRTMAQQAKRAAASLATLSTERKNAVLLALAQRLEEEKPSLVQANMADMAAAADRGLPEAKLRRLQMGEETIAQMVEGLRTVAALPDPVGGIAREYRSQNGLEVRKVRCPLGVIMMIYEARPNVTIDAFALCFKAGNACILKGGREAGESNRRLAELVQSVLREHELNEACITQITGSRRDFLVELLRLEEFIDLVIPRGGTELIRFVHENSRIPTVQHFHGVCHMFVDEGANVSRSIELCVSAKTSAPAACNAVEAILVHEAIAQSLVPNLVQAYQSAGVEVRGDEAVAQLAEGVTPAQSDDWGREFLDLVVAMRVVSGMADAIKHIEQYGSHHTEVILTNNDDHAHLFTQRVQSSCTLVNASTRFNDGFQLGLGAEIGISTSKVHAFGPMGLEELTAQRYVVMGNWHSR
ncbi:MAG: glutamate-5-semialdehyde dehydrogenase [Planctomycetota bacterium]|jgi:glutamate-5-semialdehyde dehydrogenase